MHLTRLKLTGFRNFTAAEVRLGAGPVIVVGDNAAGKSSLLEAAQFSVSGKSFRTSREAEMVMSGADRFRIEVDLLAAGRSLRRSVSYEPGTGARVDAGGGPLWLPGGSVLCFSPDDLQLIKGPPAARRRFLDEAISRRTPAFHRLTLDYQKVLSQRNSFLQRARAGLLPLADIKPWDRQLTQLALKVHQARQSYCRQLSPHFSRACADISGNDDHGTWIVLRSQLDRLDTSRDAEEAMLSALTEAWQKDMDRLSTSVGTHRDDVEFTASGQDLKPFGSQGQQRTAVLALLLASRRMEQEAGGRLPLLLLDDVMSELDPDRRRRLMQTLDCGETDGPVAAQTIITVADQSLFSDDELEASAVIEVRAGAIVGAGVDMNV
ncbi:MAG: DNA replication/repair protein RecF [Thermoleophilia bacterium]